MEEDAFARLGLVRRAWLAEEELKQAWLQRSRECHPDQEGGNATVSALVNAAYEKLREPESRLKHLLELETPEGTAWSTVPMNERLMAVFLRLGPVLQAVEAHARKRASAASALAKAVLSGEQLRLQEDVEARLEELQQLRDELDTGLMEVDSMRQGTDLMLARERMRILQAQFAYIGKWQRQGREALLKLI